MRLTGMSAFAESHSVDFQEYLDFALSLTRISRKIIRSKLSSGFSSSLKSDNSFVTDVDLSVELAMRDEIMRVFPAHGIFGEELPTHNPDSPIRWILDPIDGTLSFKHGIPLYGTLICLEISGSPCIGVIDLPELDKTLSAAIGLGSFLNGSRYSISDLKNRDEIFNSQEVIARCDAANFIRSGSDRLVILDSLHPRVRAYSDCFGHAMSLLGRVGAMVDYNISWWDIAATKVIAEEAGAKFQIVERIVTQDRPTKYSIVVGKPTVVDWILEKLSLNIICND